MASCKGVYRNAGLIAYISAILAGYIFAGGGFYVISLGSNASFEEQVARAVTGIGLVVVGVLYILTAVVVATLYLLFKARKNS